MDTVTLTERLNKFKVLILVSFLLVSGYSCDSYADLDPYEQEYFNSQIRAEESASMDRVSQMSSMNGGGSPGDAFIDGLMSGVRQGQIRNDQAQFNKNQMSSVHRAKRDRIILEECAKIIHAKIPGLKAAIEGAQKYPNNKKIQKMYDKQMGECVKYYD